MTTWHEEQKQTMKESLEQLIINLNEYRKKLNNKDELRIINKAIEQACEVQNKKVESLEEAVKESDDVS
jgi:GTPase involved in cell partitioning and DNA repair|tara:strand:+ start:1052 stop:1258 length:207 start_codon:yes stop_codon:yes gene_type:complete